MQKIIYYLFNKIFLNEVESEILDYLEKKDRIIFDVGCFRGNFTKNIIYKNIDLLKLDTEGNEFDILKGAEKLLSLNKIKVIYTEISGTKVNFNNKVNEIVKLLNNYNFEHKRIYKMPVFSFLSGLKSTDNLFVSKNIYTNT